MKNYLLLLTAACLYATSAHAQIELVQELNPTSVQKELRIVSQFGLAGGKPLMSYENHPEYGSELWTLDESNQLVLLMDIIPGTGSSEPDQFFQFGDKVIFTANTLDYGYIPWISDGTTEGTVPVLTSYNNVGTSYPQDYTAFGEGEFIFEESNDNFRRLWKSDGTTEGSTMILEFPQTQGGSYSFFGADSLVFFNSSTPEEGAELWVTDGTEAGTKLVKDIYPGTSGGNVHGMFGFEGKVYFDAQTPEEGVELWVTDGTTEGTMLVKDINTGTGQGIQPGYFTPVILNGKFYFTAQGTTGGYELWSSDGTTEGTALLTDLNTSSENASSTPRYQILADSVIIFAASRNQDGSTEGTELWKTDGTEEGTVLLKDIRSGTNPSHPAGFHYFNGKIYFSAYDGVDDGVWVTDGSEEGTLLVKHIDFGSSNQYRDMIASDTELFIATQEQDAPQLYVSDGTPEGTLAISQEVTIHNSSSPRDFTAFKDGFVFTASRESTDEGISLFYSTGGAAIDLLPDSVYTINSLYSDFRFVNIGDKLLFLGSTEGAGEELWVTDGTTDGTMLLKDIYPGGVNSRPEDLTLIGDKVYFTARDGVNGYELWVTDGTTAGTYMVKDIYAGSNESNPRYFRELNGKCYFNAQDGTSGRELWVTDGTEEGTQLVVDFNPGTNAGAWINAFVFNGKLIIRGHESSTNTYELIASDGTAEGTERFSNIMDGDGVVGINYHAIFDDYLLFFTYVNSIEAYQIWKTDATSEGTELVTSDFYSFVYEGTVGESLIYFAKDAEGKVHLMSTNGATKATDTLVANVPIAIGGEDDLNDQNSLLIDGKLYISDGAYQDSEEGDSYGTKAGTTIWITDGTKAGTTSISADYEGNPLAPMLLFEEDGAVFFTGFNKEINTYTLYHTTGDECGTQKLVADDAKIEGQLFSFNNYFYFRASTLSMGSELYRYSLSTEIPDRVIAWYLDADGDGLGDLNETIIDCVQPDGYVDNSNDCDDTNAQIGTFTWYADADGDGLGDAATTVEACSQPEGYVDNTDDCDDSDAAISIPVWYQDADADGLGNAEMIAEGCEQPEGYVSNADDCDDADSSPCEQALANDLSLSVKVYPNPFISKVQVDLPVKGKISLIDINGHQLSKDHAANASFDTQNLTPGLYFLLIEIEGKSSIHKLIKN